MSAKFYFIPLNYLLPEKASHLELSLHKKKSYCIFAGNSPPFQELAEVRGVWRKLHVSGWQVNDDWCGGWKMDLGKGWEMRGESHSTSSWLQATRHPCQFPQTNKRVWSVRWVVALRVERSKVRGESAGHPPCPPPAAWWSWWCCSSSPARPSSRSRTACPAWALRTRRRRENYDRLSFGSCNHLYAATVRYRASLPEGVLEKTQINKHKSLLITKTAPVQ